MRRLLPFLALPLLLPALRAETPGLYADIDTPKGRITAELFYREAPLTVTAFVTLAEGRMPNTFRKDGEPFFDGLTWHRVVPNFVIQGGDPKGDGEGGPGWSFRDEFNPALRHDAPGILSMANDGPDTNGSQFFITHRAARRLDYLHGVFGRVVAGQDVVDRVAQGDKIERVRIRRVGTEAEKFEPNVAGFEIFQKRLALLPRVAPPPDGYLVDGTGTMEAARVKNFNFKLANYEKWRRTRIVVRLFDENRKARETKMADLAKELGAERGALLCYFAGEDQWRLWVGTNLFPALNDGRPVGDEEAFIKEKLHGLKQALLREAQELSKEKKLREGVNSVLDALILRLDDHALGRPAKAP